MMIEQLDVRPLSDVAGAEVRGVSLSQEQSAQTQAALREAFKKHGLLLFRDQELSDEAQLRAGGIFGTISYQGENYKQSAGTRYVSNVAEDGLNKAGELTFHVDHSFYDTPLRAIMLYALEAPPAGAGGETLFASMKLAYDNLPDALREKIKDMKALHCYDFDLSRNKKAADRVREKDLGPTSTRAVHPVVLTHPGTGEKILFISRRHVDRILDIPEEESEALLAELVSYIEGTDKIYKHTWRPGDLVIWDNLLLQHARTNFDPKHRRHLRRCQLI